MWFSLFISFAFLFAPFARADPTDQLPCESIICPPGSTMCMYNKKSMENRQNTAISISCFNPNGTLTQNSDTVIPNPNPQTRTDITAFSILNVSGTKERQKELMNAIIDIVRRFMANQTVSSPYGFNGMPGYPGGSMPFIVNMPPQPAPVITITNMAPPSSGYSSFVSRDGYSNLPGSPPMSNPNMMPSSLATIYERIMQMRTCMNELEKAVQDASAAAPPPQYGSANNVAFPVSMPYNPNVNSYK